MDIWGTIVLLLTTIVASALLTAALFGAMFGINKFAADKLPDSSYENFDFNNITRPTLSEFLSRLGLVVFPPTVLLPILIFLLFPPLSAHGFRAHYLLLSFTIILLEAAAIATGLLFVVKLDRPRIALFTGILSFCYILLFWLMIYNDLYS